MTIGAGYFFGGLILILYAMLVFYVGKQKPEKLFRLTKAKLGGKFSDETVVKICYVWSVVALIIGISVFVLGYINA